MDLNFEKEVLIKKAEDFLGAAEEFDGTPPARAGLSRQLDRLRWYTEDAAGALMRQWEAVR